VIVVGGAGSGKTTQLPQFLRSAGWTKDGYQVAVTQPRHAAVAAVAGRLCEEVGCLPGTAVGWCARFQQLLTPVSALPASYF
jgi:HrpA-like RNA helicase